MTLLDDNSFPPRNLETDEEILLYISKHMRMKVHNQGYEWFWTVYMPALERVAKSRTVDAEIIADNFYAAGDVHDFNRAPAAAIPYYKRALEFDPELCTAHREIASMNRQLGNFETAIEHSDIALSISPDCKFNISDRQQIDDEQTVRIKKPNDSEIAVAKALEELAQQNPKAAIETLRGFEDKDCLRALTWAYGADGDISAYLRTWKTLILKIRELRFDFQDFFFMPERIWYDHEIWKIWNRSNLSFSGVFILYEGLDEDQCDIEIDQSFAKLSTSDSIAQKIEYVFYCQSENLDGLKAIQIKYPNWVELGEKIKALESQ